jgi:acetyl esterase/lipase
MASWQSYVMAWTLRRKLKPRLAHAKIPYMRKLMTPPPLRLPENVSFSVGEVGGVAGEWVSRAGRAENTLLYLHGGGYFACSAETHRAITIGFAEQGFRVFAPNYRLAPEHRFPAALEDAIAVYQALMSPRIVLAGDSAGGGLALALMIAARVGGLALPAAAGLFSPWTDLAATGESLVRNDRRCAMFFGGNIGKSARIYLDKEDPRNPLASPLYADLSNLPPLLIHAAKNETLLDDSVRLAERARATGVPVELKIWPVVPHCWQLGYPRLPEARRSIGEAAGFLTAAIDADAQGAVA